MKVKELVEKLLNHLDPSAEIETVANGAIKKLTKAFGADVRGK